MSLEILSKEYAESTFISGPVIKTITSSDGSVSVFTNGPNVDLKVNGGGGVALGDVKAKVFNFYLANSSNDWLFEGETVVNIFKSLDGFDRVRIGHFSFNQTNWTHSDPMTSIDSFYSQPVTIRFRKETSINEILSNFTDPEWLISSYFLYAYPLVHISDNW